MADQWQYLSTDNTITLDELIERLSEIRESAGGSVAVPEVTKIRYIGAHGKKTPPHRPMVLLTSPEKVV